MDAQTLEQIENDFWGQPEISDTNLIKRIYDLRKKIVHEFDVEDLRILISQGVSLDIVIPMAIEVLKKDFFAEGDYYEGDLLKSVLTSSKGFWEKNINLKKEIVILFEKYRQKLAKLDTTHEIRLGIIEAYEKWQR